MDKLSQELIDQITSYFSPISDSDDLPRILTVSKAFQASVERKMLAQYHLTENNVDNFLRQYTGERIYYLRYVQFLPILPVAIGVDRNRDKGCREKSNELHRKVAPYHLHTEENCRGRSLLSSCLRLLACSSTSSRDTPSTFFSSHPRVQGRGLRFYQRDV
jgi:hypothetical protein